MASKFAALSTPQKTGTHTPKNLHSRRVSFRLRYVAVLAVVIWGAYQYFHVQRVEYQALRSKEEALQAQLQAMQEQQTDLEQQAQELQNDDYIARYASQHFNLVMPGQVSFVVHH